MTSSALFASTSAHGGSTGNSKHLVEFRAGRMTLKGRMVYPDKRKGFLYVYQSDDSLMHFCWKDRVSGAVEDDLIIFPDDCEFLKVHQCSTGRVFVLKFKSSSRKLFFWMQEPKTDKDEEYCRRINEVLNNPPTVGGGRGGNSSNAPDGDLQNLLSSMSQQQLMQLFGNVGQMSGLSSLLGTISRPSTGASSRGSSATPGSRTTESRAPSRPPRVDAPLAPTTSLTGSAGITVPSSATTKPTTQPTQAQPKSGQAIHLSDLQRYLSRLSVPGSASGSMTVDSGGSGSQLASALVSPTAVAAVTTHAATLVNHLPKQVEKDVDPQSEVKANLLSPQFAQAAKLFSNALSSGQLGPVISQFGLGEDIVNAAAKGDVDEFIKALEKSENKSGAMGSDDDKMLLD